MARPTFFMPPPSPLARPSAGAIPSVVPNLPLSGPSGPATVSGQVSYFRAETGEILYLSGARIFISREALMAAGGITASPAQAEALRGLHRDRIAQLLRQGAILRAGVSDKFGRFELSRLPEGECYLLGMADEFGRYLMWQRKLRLEGGRPERVYLNRNNLDLRIR